MTPSVLVTHSFATFTLSWPWSCLACLSPCVAHAKAFLANKEIGLGPILYMHHVITHVLAYLLKAKPKQ